MYKPNCKQKIHQVIRPPPACIEMNSTCYVILKLKKAIIIQKVF